MRRALSAVDCTAAMGIIRPAGGQRRPRARNGKEHISVTSPPDPPEVVEAETETVKCDGGGGALGHPRVWLNMADKGAVDCPYCDRRFVLKAGAGRGH